MKILPINNQTNMSCRGYRNLSKEIMASDRKSLINIAEYFHTAPESELNEITGSNPSVLNRLKEAIDGVVTRKKCYIADGASFCKQRAEELDKKAAQRQAFYAVG